MKCSELMKTDLECCEPGDAVEQVAERMRSRNIGFVPVCDSDGKVVGTITDRDLVLRVLAEHRDAEATSVGEVMSKEVVACRAEDDLSTAEGLMSKHKKSRVICVDDAGHPTGVISLSDIARSETGGKASAILRSVAQREAHL